MTLHPKRFPTSTSTGNKTGAPALVQKPEGTLGLPKATVDGDPQRTAITAAPPSPTLPQGFGPAQTVFQPQTTISTASLGPGGPTGFPQFPNFPIPDGTTPTGTDFELDLNRDRDDRLKRKEDILNPPEEEPNQPPPQGSPIEDFIEYWLANPSSLTPDIVEALKKSFADQQAIEGAELRGEISQDAARRGVFFSTIPTGNLESLGNREGVERRAFGADLDIQAVQMRDAAFKNAVQAAFGFEKLSQQSDQFKEAMAFDLLKWEESNDQFSREDLRRMLPDVDWDKAFRDYDAN